MVGTLFTKGGIVAFRQRAALKRQRRAASRRKSRGSSRRGSRVTRITRRPSRSTQARITQSAQAATRRTAASTSRDSDIEAIKASLGLPTGSDISSQVQELLKSLGGGKGQGGQLDLSRLGTLGLAKAKFELERRRKEASQAAAKETRGKQRETAVKTATLQRKSLALRAEERESGLSRQLSGLRRQDRQTRARILSGAAGGGTLGTSAFRASRIAGRSAVKREEAFAQETASRAQRGEELREKEIAGTLETTLFAAREPENVFLSQGDIDLFAGQGEGITRSSSTLIT